MILYQEQKIFLDNCLDVLDKHGTDIESYIMFGEETSVRLYEDEVITILKSSDDKHMLMTRHRTDSNFFYFYDGVTISFHHEYVYLEDHISTLL